MKLESIIEALRRKHTEFVETFQGEIKKLKEQLKVLSSISSDFENNWVGQWASPNYNVYNDFIGGKEYLKLDEDFIRNFIEEKSGISLKEIEDVVPSISKEYQSFQDYVITELAILKGKQDFEPEIEILQKLEDHKWGITPWDYLKMKQPQSIYTHDPSIINKGIKIPPHLKISCELMSLFSILASIESFDKNVNRILRQLEVKHSFEEPKPIAGQEFIYDIINSFHVVARQIQNRYDNRETLTINDEYDVQDLLHAMLKIKFDDIRPEEYTPSYAGSSTRMDFLLNNERTVIEVKKTRKGLADKEVGDQLILDAQHYKTHPKCERLICFVYDPENRIQNPRGLETDLNNLSTEDLIVETYIRP